MEDNPSNAMAVTWDGDIRINGNVYTNCNNDSTGGTMLPKDVQVNGISVVSSGVANVPLATSNSVGVVKTSAAYGTVVDENGLIKISRANSGGIKSGAVIFQPIVPITQHEAAFYGLAKAAGDTTQSQSSNAVGTYTDQAKAAIQSMLGIEPGLKVVRLI